VCGANIQIFHYFGHGYLKEEKSMIHRSTITFGAKYLTGMVTSVAPYETFSLIKNNILHRSNNYKNHFENSNFWVIWPLGHVGHVTYSFINMLFISTRIFYDKLRPQILSVGTTANAALSDRFDCTSSYIYIALLRIRINSCQWCHIVVSNIACYFRFVNNRGL
jgi:hypothetical protein